MHESVIKQLAQLVLSYQPVGLVRIEIVHKWFADGCEVGPGIRYLDKFGHDLGNRMERSKSRELSNLFDVSKQDLRHHAADSGLLPNVFRMYIEVDGATSYDLIYDSTLDEEEEKRMRESIGDELYERFKREDRERAALPATQPGPPPQPAANSQALTIPQLLGAIHDEATSSAPTNWQTVEVEGRVWMEQGKQSVEVGCDYYLPNSTERQKLKLRQHLPTLNALLQLNRAMTVQGNNWMTIKLTFTANDPDTLVDWH